jgi:hypothetical protein
VGIFDQQRKITRFESIDETDLLEPSDALDLFNISINQLAALPDDWWGGHGGSYPEGHIRQLRWAFYRLALGYGIPLPVIFPLEPGQVRAEWRPRPQDVSMEIRLNDGCSYVHALNLETKVAFEQDNVLFNNYDEVATVLAGLLPQEA